MQERHGNQDEDESGDAFQSDGFEWLDVVNGENLFFDDLALVFGG